MEINEQMSRRAARLAAVQALYQMEMSSATIEDVIAEFQSGKLPRETDNLYTELEGDIDLFKVLVENAVNRQRTIDRAIARHLKNWKLERLDAVARAILRAGAVELEQRLDIPTPVVLNEYVEIANSFFEGPEPGFINATLESCALDLRPTQQGA